MNRPLTLILGVHRSGTSLLTQGLMAAGAQVGAFAEYRDPHNPEGYAEHPLVRQFNDRLLARLGVSWDNWGFRASTVDWDAADLGPLRDAAVAILQAAFAGPGPFVLKDPRCTTLAPFWERVIPQAGFALRRILILRDPVEVAESQRQRAIRRPHEFSVIATAEPMAALWAVTMTECLAALPDDATLLLGHADLLAAPAATLTTAARFAGLAADADRIARVLADGVKPALYRARSSLADPGTGDGVWMQAARHLFDDLLQGGLPRPLPRAAARAIAARQPRIAALQPGLAAVQASIAQMLAVDAARQSRSTAFNLMIWSLAPLGAWAPGPALSDAIDRALALADSSDLAQTSVAFVHTIGRLLLFAGRRSEALAWLDRARPQFGHMEALVQLEQAILDLPADRVQTGSAIPQ